MYNFENENYIMKFSYLFEIFFSYVKKFIYLFVKDVC